MSKIFRVGVLGMSHDHLWDNLPGLMETGRVELLAAADPHPELCQRIAKEYGCATYVDPHKLLDCHQLDAVLLFGDNASSVELTEVAASRGLHVLVEKPMASTLAGAERMVRAVRRAGVRLMVNWPFAWWPQLQHALELAQTGTIGRVWEIRYRAAHAGPREMGCSQYFVDWLEDSDRNGAGAFMDYCCYGAALARCLLGMPSRVTGITGRVCKEDTLVEDNGVLVCEYADGLAVSEGSWTQIDKLTAYRPTFYGTTGTLHLEPRLGGRLWYADADNPDGGEVSVPELPEHRQSAGAHFVHGLTTGEPFLPLCTDSVCRDVQEILEAGLLSAGEHRAASLPLPRGE